MRPRLDAQTGLGQPARAPCEKAGVLQLESNTANKSSAQPAVAQIRYVLSAVCVVPGSSAVQSHCQPRTQGKPQQHGSRLRLPADTDPARRRVHQDLTLLTDAPRDPRRAVAEFERHRRRSRHHTQSARPTLAIRGFPGNPPL